MWETVLEVFRPTTGKHLNYLSEDKEGRLNQADFDAALADAFPFVEAAL